MLTVAQSADPTSLSPYRFGSTNDRNIITNIYDTLVEFDLETYEIVPSLATAWSISDDGLAWTFEIRPDVIFHDGSALDAEDVVASIERAMEPESNRTTSLLTRVSDVAAVDEDTVEVNLSEPDRILLSTLIDVYISPSDESIDLAARKISLALATVSRAAEEATQSVDEFRQLAAKTEKTSFGSFGDLLKKAGKSK